MQWIYKAVFLFCFFVPAKASSSEIIELVGVVTDYQSRKPIPEYSVEVYSIKKAWQFWKPGEMKLNHHALTNENGGFRITISDKDIVDFSIRGNCWRYYSFEGKKLLEIANNGEVIIEVKQNALQDKECREQWEPYKNY